MDVVKSFYDIQHKNLKIEEINGRAQTKEVDSKQKELDITLLTEEPKTNSMDPILRAWLAKQHKMIQGFL
jgi:hypothetical protein